MRLSGVQLETWSIQLWDAMGYERVKTRMEDELGDLPQWISDLDGGFYKQDETIEYATPVSHFVKMNFGIKVMPNFP